MCRYLLPAVLFLSVLLSSLAGAYAASYRFTHIDVPGNLGIQANGINAAGQIVGSFAKDTGSHGFLTSDGASFTILDVPGTSGSTSAYGINDAGQIVGQYYNPMGSHGFVTDGVMFTPIDVPGAVGTWAYGINNAGQIVGYFYDAKGAVHGFVTDGATFTAIDAPGAVVTIARGINDAGQIVGYFYTHTEDHGFLTDGASLTIFDVPGAMGSYAHGINNAGQIAGYFQDPTGAHGFLTDDVSFTTLTILDVPGPTETTANGVNDAGEIVGTFVPHLGSPQGFLAIPQVIPVITVSANPATLSPPNGRLIPVTVSGAITDEPGGSGINASSAAYRVMDEYGRVQPSGRVTLGTDGRYAFTVALQASRDGDDRDGRRYVIVVSATDNGGNVGVVSATVTVPRK